MVQQYEILLMLDPDLPEGRQEEIIKRTRELVERANGKWVRHDVWGRRKLAYPISRFYEGNYVVTQLQMDPNQTRGLEVALRISDDVLRHLLVRKDDVLLLRASDIGIGPQSSFVVLDERSGTPRVSVVVATAGPD